MLADDGYQVEMLKEVPGGNSYGKKEGTNPDYLIEGRAFDAYAPEKGRAMKSIKKKRNKQTEKQTDRETNRQNCASVKGLRGESSRIKRLSVGTDEK